MSLITNPGSISVATPDYPTIEYDASPILEEGETIASASVRMQSSDFARQVNLPDAPTFTTTTVSQPIRGAILTAGVLYRMIWTISLNNGQVLSQQTSCQVPF